MENKLENPYFSTRLFGLNNYLEDLINTFENKIFPSTSLIIGKKGIGKFTLINHFLNYIFDKSYDREKCMINLNSDFSKKYLGGTFPNIIYLGENKAITPKIDDIRKLRDLVAHSSEFAETDEMCFSASRAVNFTLSLLSEISILDKKL